MKVETIETQDHNMRMIGMVKSGYRRYQLRPRNQPFFIYPELHLAFEIKPAVDNVNIPKQVFIEWSLKKLEFSSSLNSSGNIEVLDSLVNGWVRGFGKAAFRAGDFRTAIATLKALMKMK